MAGGKVYAVEVGALAPPRRAHAKEEQRKAARSMNAAGELLLSTRLRKDNQTRARSGLKSEKWAEESAERYRDLVDGLDAIVWEANIDPWQYTFVSQRAQVLFGYPVERWLRDPTFWMDVIHPEDRVQTVSLWKAGASARKDLKLEYRVIASDGRIMWVSMMAHVRQQGHRPAQFRGVLLDIGDSIRAGTLQTLVAHQTAELLSGHEQLRALATELICQNIGNVPSWPRSCTTISLNCWCSDD